MIILVGGEKGGTGKTTISTNLCVFRAMDRKDVLLIDTDQQSSASYWCGTRDENKVLPRISCVQYFGKGFINQVKDLSRRYDDVIIDAGGRDSTELRDSFLIANLVVIPLAPSQYDIWTLSRMNELAEKSLNFNCNLKILVVINKSASNPSIKETNEAMSALDEFNSLILSKAIIKDRIAFRRGVPNGLGINEQAPIDEKAVNEFTILYKEVFCHDNES